MTGHPEAAGAPPAVTDAAVAKLNEAVADGGYWSPDLAPGVVPCVPGFLAAVGLVEAETFWTDLYHYAWFLSFGTSLLVYAGLTLRRPDGEALPRGC